MKEFSLLSYPMCYRALFVHFDRKISRCLCSEGHGFYESMLHDCPYHPKDPETRIIPLKQFGRLLWFWDGIRWHLTVDRFGEPSPSIVDIPLLFSSSPNTVKAA